MGNKKSLRYGELFCGPGGLARGAIDAGLEHSEYSIKHSWANDNDEWACKTYAHNICGNMNDESVIHGDVRKINFKNLGKIEILAFGFPCNDFSLVGEQKGIEGKFGPLYRYGVNALKLKTPQAFVAENVGGLISSNSGDAFKLILKDFVNAGYRITVNKFKFEEYGIPQNRHRILIVGLKENDFENFYEIPKPTKTIVTSKEALENPKIPEEATNQEPTNHPPKVKLRLSQILPGQNAWNADLDENLKLNVKNVKLSQIYRRLNPNEPAYTVTGSGGGGTHMYHYDMKKFALNNRERARLQTFPDDYKFLGGKEQVRKQIGMAVPVRGAKFIFSALLNTLSGRSYKYTEPSIGYFYSGNINEIDYII